MNKKTNSKREPQDEDDQRLLDDGWEFAGMGLFTHCSLAFKPKSKAYTKEQALDMFLGYYCPACGACGIEQCCSPDRCKCMFKEEYTIAYDDMSKDWGDMHAFILRLTDPHAYIDRFILAGEAEELLTGETK
jgi:hypothetical protein